MKLNNFTSDGWGHGKKSLAVTSFTQCFHFIRFPGLNLTMYSSCAEAQMAGYIQDVYFITQ